MAMRHRLRSIPFSSKILTYVIICSTALFLRVRVVMSCEFPEALRMEEADPPWISHVRAGPATATSGGGTVGVLPHDTEYFIRRSVMEVHYPGAPDRAHVRWRCSMAYNNKLLLKRQDHLINNFYRCVKINFRSPSLVQIAWSYEARKFDLALCGDEALTLDPWLLVRSQSLHLDHAQCPFSGGFDMKLTDSQLGDSACNLMLRPMRLETECVGGDGVTFDFVSSNCLPDVRMFVHQRTLCVANWKDQENHYVVLRRNEDSDLWCFVMPASKSLHSTKTAYLYSDLACMQHPPVSESASPSKSPSLPSSGKSPRYFTLRLNTRIYSTLCEDEYSACSSITCNAYVERECQRSCRVCDPENSFSSCEYPRRLQGLWQLQDIDGTRQLQISGSNFTLARVGNFHCVTYPDGPKRKSRVYTAVTLSDNGCRPRYSCLKIKRLGPAVISYSLSHSFTWPGLQEHFGSKICADDRFFPDPSPLDDLYRSYQGSGKPVVSLSPKAQLVNCNISAVMNVSAELLEGYTCQGKIYKHCEDPTKLRVEYNSCGGDGAAITSDYRCMANFDGHYWEKIILLQNIHKPEDSRCFVFSQYYPGEAYSLLAAQCDKHAFEFARSGLRKPLARVTFNLQGDKCKSWSLETVTVPTTVSSRTVTSQPQRLVNSHATMGDQSRQGHGGSGTLELVEGAEPKHSYREPGTSVVQKSLSVENGETVESPTSDRSSGLRLWTPVLSVCVYSAAIIAILQMPLT
ncbi:hypothetical protein ElyMa_003324300 [Elysia marginata]|uniref:Uncharacterized protein n=1 Tax=Elysia marginata TaxID=1093978 RepID=A0AAV4JER1_9GAST|nr:hypothetical protein ElyMa_003324300 [Elysia marginata]